MVDTLCLVTGPRTGAGHLMRLAANFRELRACPGLFSSLEEQLDPAGTLERAEAEARAGGQRVLMFALKPDSLPAETVEAAVLDRRGVRLVLVVRRQIDAYVSWCKAAELGRWEGIDTSAHKVRLDADEFAAWLDVQEHWFARWRRWLERRHLPAPVLRYETEIDQPPQAVLQRLSAAAAQVGVVLRLPANIAHPGLERQDRVKAVADRIGNWPQFSRALMTRGLEKRAFGYPV